MSSKLQTFRKHFDDQGPIASSFVDNHVVTSYNYTQLPSKISHLQHSRMPGLLRLDSVGEVSSSRLPSDSQVYKGNTKPVLRNCKSADVDIPSMSKRLFSTSNMASTKSLTRSPNSFYTGNQPLSAPIMTRAQQLQPHFDDKAHYGIKSSSSPFEFTLHNSALNKIFPAFSSANVNNYNNLYSNASQQSWKSRDTSLWTGIEKCIDKEQERKPQSLLSQVAVAYAASSNWAAPTESQQPATSDKKDSLLQHATDLYSLTNPELGIENALKNIETSKHMTPFNKTPGLASDKLDSNISLNNNCFEETSLTCVDADLSQSSLDDCQHCEKTNLLQSLVDDCQCGYKTYLPQSSVNDCQYSNKTNLPQSSVDDCQHSKKTDLPQSSVDDCQHSKKTDLPQSSVDDCQHSKKTDLPQSSLDDYQYSEKTDLPQSSVDCQLNEKTDFPQGSINDFEHNEKSELFLRSTAHCQRKGKRSRSFCCMKSDYVTNSCISDSLGNHLKPLTEFPSVLAAPRKTAKKGRPSSKKQKKRQREKRSKHHPNSSVCIGLSNCSESTSEDNDKTERSVNNLVPRRESDKPVSLKTSNSFITNFIPKESPSVKIQSKYPITKFILMSDFEESDDDSDASSYWPPDDDSDASSDWSPNDKDSSKYIPPVKCSAFNVALNLDVIFKRKSIPSLKSVLKSEDSEESEWESSLSLQSTKNNTTDNVSSSSVDCSFNDKSDKVCVPIAAAAAALAPFGLSMGLTLDSLFSKRPTVCTPTVCDKTDTSFDVVDGLSLTCTNQQFSSSFESCLEAIKKINAQWDENYPTAGFRSCQVSSADEITNSSIKVHFATGAKLKTIHIVGTEDRAGTWQQDQERFQRRILDLEKVISPVLQLGHRAKFLEKM